MSSSCAFIPHGLLSKIQGYDLAKMYNVIGVFSTIFCLLLIES